MCDRNQPPLLSNSSSVDFVVIIIERIHPSISLAVPYKARLCYIGLLCDRTRLVVSVLREIRTLAGRPNKGGDQGDPV